MERFQKYSEFLEEHGIRASSQRVLMLEYLDENLIHPTADKIYTDLSSKLPAISKATIYNNLKLFVDHGIVKEVNIDNNEIHYDVQLHQHGHFICEKCNKIFNFDISVLSLDSFELDGCSVKHKDVFFRGVCKECLER